MLLARLGLGDEPSRASKYLRTILTFVKEAGEQQLSQFPLLGPLLKGAVAALLELADEQDEERLERRLLAAVQETQEGIAALMGLAGFVFQQQLAQTGEVCDLLRRLEAQGLPAAPKQLTEFAISTALVGYRSRVALDYLYADYRGIAGITRAEHAARLGRALSRPGD